MRSHPTSARLALAAAAVVLAACTAKPDTETPRSGVTAGSGPAGAVNVAGPDSARDTVVMGSAPPTAQDSSVAVPRTAGTTDTNRSGMAVPSGGAAPRP